METITNQAAVDSGLAAEYAGDPALLEFYKRRLLKKGWAGTKTPAETQYVAQVHRAEGKYQGAGERLAEARRLRSVHYTETPSPDMG